MKHERAQVSKSLYFELELLRLDVVNVLIIILSHSVITSFKMFFVSSTVKIPTSWTATFAGGPSGEIQIVDLLKTRL